VNFYEWLKATLVYMGGTAAFIAFACVIAIATTKYLKYRGAFWYAVLLMAGKRPATRKQIDYIHSRAIAELEQREAKPKDTHQ
jgi:hypothetical protein